MPPVHHREVRARVLNVQLVLLVALRVTLILQRLIFPHVLPRAYPVHGNLPHGGSTSQSAHVLSRTQLNARGPPL